MTSLIRGLIVIDQRRDFRSRSVASAFLTSDCEIPNFRAIAEGLTPALNAARTAFSLPFVSECPASSSVGTFDAEGLGNRPRRSASLVTAASRVSTSVSSKRCSAPARSFGSKYRVCAAELSTTALPCGTAGDSGALGVGAAENRSGVVSADRRVGMTPTMPLASLRGNRPGVFMQLPLKLPRE